MELRTNKHREMLGWELECIRKFPKNELVHFKMTDNAWVSVHSGAVVISSKSAKDDLMFAQASLGPFWTGSCGWVAETGISRDVFKCLRNYLAEQGLLESQKEERALEILSLIEKEFSDDAGRQLPTTSSPE